jgi:hypothetical protein
MPAAPGYSGKPLSEKLGIRPGHRVSLRGAPAEFPAALDPLPPDVTLVAPDAPSPDLVLLFAREAAALEREFGVAARTLPRGAMLWTAWPKKAAKQPTDLTEDVVRRIGLATGLVDVKVCAVTEVWSGLKWVRRRGEG